MMFYLTLYIDEDSRPDRQDRFTRSFMGNDEDGKIRAAVGEFITNFMRGGEKDVDVRNTETGHEHEDRG